MLVYEFARHFLSMTICMMGITSLTFKELSVFYFLLKNANAFPLNSAGTYEGAVILNWDQRLGIVMEAARGLHYPSQ